MKRVFCAPVMSRWKLPPKPTGQDTLPLVSTWPLFGLTVPPIICIIVDLPAPLRPSSPTETPEGKVSVMLSATILGPEGVQKDLVRFSRWIIAGILRGGRAGNNRSG